MVASVIAALLYLRIMISMWLTDEESGDDNREAIKVPFTAGFVVAGSAFFTLLVGVWPGWLIDASQAALQLAK
jgi:NADH-quinone oxidoreductase subunit N